MLCSQGQLPPRVTRFTLAWLACMQLPRAGSCRSPAADCSASGKLDAGEYAPRLPEDETGLATIA